MSDWIKEADEKIDDFFDDLSDEELEIALTKANYGFYKAIDFPVLALTEKAQRLPFQKMEEVVLISGFVDDSLRSKPEPSTAANLDKEYSELTWGNSPKAVDDHTYAMAA